MEDRKKKVSASLTNAKRRTTKKRKPKGSTPTPPKSKAQKPPKAVEAPKPQNPPVPDSQEDKSKGGRPPVILDPAVAQAFGRMKATYETMAEYFRVSHDTIARRMSDPESEFCVAYKKGFATMRLNLSEKQIAIANAGNVTMCIWLGKQYLGQSDKQEVVGGIYNTQSSDPEECRAACREIMQEFGRNRA